MGHVFLIGSSLSDFVYGLKLSHPCSLCFLPPTSWRFFINQDFSFHNWSECWKNICFSSRIHFGTYSVLQNIKTDKQYKHFSDQSSGFLLPFYYTILKKWSTFQIYIFQLAPWVRENIQHSFRYRVLKSTWGVCILVPRPSSLATYWQTPWVYHAWRENTLN